MSTTDDTGEKKTNWQEKTLKLAGYGYSVGDLSMAAAAKLRGESNVFNGALIWLAGGIAAARYGNPEPHVQVQLLSRKLEKHLQDQGVSIPDDARAQHALLQKPGFFKQCQEFLYQHPSEMLNAAYGIGAALLLKDGIHELSTGKKLLMPKFTQGYGTQGVLHAVNGISKNFWMGAVIGAGALAGIAVKEDKGAAKRAEHGNVLQKAVAYIQEKPLRLTGTLYGLNNIFTVLKAVEDHSHYRTMSGALKPHYFSGTTAATYILSNVLLTTVTRDQTGKKLPASEFNKLEVVAARVIAAQPVEKQAEIINDVAAYLAQEKSAPYSKEQLAEHMQAQIATLASQQPSASAQGWVAREGTRVAADTSVTV